MQYVLHCILVLFAQNNSVNRVLSVEAVNIITSQTGSIRLSVVKLEPQAIAVFMLMELLGLSLVATIQPVGLDTKSSITLWSRERTPEYEFSA